MGIMMAWYAPTPTTAYVRPKGASPTRLALVPAYNACTSPNSTHGAPLSNNSCNPPVQSSSFLTMGSPDANGAGANGTGSLSMIVVPGNSSTPADEADVKLKLSALDVRKKSDLTDYTGQLQATAGVRITDRDNGPAELGTGDTTYSFTVPCAATGSTTIGSTCSIDTTADALVANTIKEGQRAVWQLGKVDVTDGGADGLASTGPNTRYLTQGYFVP
jgi:hypothetical protein